MNDEAQSWSVHEYDAEKKKKKKSKGNLLVGNGMLCYGSETDKASPVRQFSINDIKHHAQDGKNVHIEVADTANTILDFQTSSKSEAKAIAAKIDSSKSVASATEATAPHHVPATTPPAPSLDNHYDEDEESENEFDHPAVPEPDEEPAAPIKPACEERWAIVLYDFNAEGPEELTVKENEQVLVTDYVSSDEWWNIEHQDGRKGIVPASYVQFQEDYEASLAAEDENRRKQEEESERQQREAEAAAARQRRMEEDRRRREEEAERQRRMQEEAARKREQEEKQRKEQEAKRQAAAAASASAAAAAQGSASPRRSQIPAPPPPVKAAAGRQMPSDQAVKAIHTPSNRSLPDRPKQAQDPGKPDPAKVRTWTDRTGAFKVEAQLLACHNGKIRLHKINGVKIDVPLQKMCMEDLRYIEQETGQKLMDDKADDIPLAQLASQSKGKGAFDWLEYFKRANMPLQSAQQYAATFRANGLSQADLDNLTHRKMKALGMSESHVQRLQRFIETESPEPASDDEGAPKKKGKKSVSFGTTSYIEDEDETGEHDKQWQIDQDERYARQLQEQLNSQQQGSPSGGLQRRGMSGQGVLSSC